MLAATPLAGPVAGGIIDTSEAITRNLLYVAMAVFLVWPAVFGSRRWAAIAFANRPMRWLGEISYSVFLLHLVILQGVMNLLGYREFSGSMVVVFVLTAAASVAVSSVTFRFIEVPAMSLRRLVVARRGRTEPAPAAAPIAPPAR